MNNTQLDEFIKLPYKSKVDKVTKLFIDKCCDPEVVRKKKYTATYFPIKIFLAKQEIQSIHILYDYLSSLDTKVIQDLTSVFIAADKYQQEQRIASDRILQDKVKTTEYKEYEECLKEMMKPNV
jgi:hypothetical protein